MSICEVCLNLEWGLFQNEVLNGHEKGEDHQSEHFENETNQCEDDDSSNEDDTHELSDEEMAVDECLTDENSESDDVSMLQPEEKGHNELRRKTSSS